MIFMEAMEASTRSGGATLIRIFCLALVMIFLGLFYVHESNQQNRIKAVEDKITLLQAESNKKVVQWDSENYNYLAIGNSITLHGINDYWWNECGMAASTLENDYVH